VSSRCAIQEKEHRDGRCAFIPLRVQRPVLCNPIAALQMEGLALVQLQPNLSIRDNRSVDRVRLVYRRIFVFEVIGSSPQTNQCFASCDLAIE